MQYPAFTKYPHHVIEYQSKIREKALQEEEDLKRKEDLLL